jgi:hypothetical protein
VSGIEGNETSKRASHRNAGASNYASEQVSSEQPRVQNYRGEHQSEQTEPKISKRPTFEAPSGHPGDQGYREVIVVEARKVSKQESKGPSTQVLSKRPSIEASEHARDQRRQTEQHLKAIARKWAWKRASILLLSKRTSIQVSEHPNDQHHRSEQRRSEQRRSERKYRRETFQIAFLFAIRKSRVISSRRHYSVLVLH